MTVCGSFKKKFLLNKGFNSPDKRCCCLKVNYREKWDRILAAFTAVLAFTLLVAYVIVSSVNERKPPSEVDDDDSIIALWVSTKATPASRNLDGGSKCQLQDECGITCTNFIGSDNITEHINAVAKDFPCNVIHPLRIMAGMMGGNAINEGWLKFLTHEVNYLVLTKITITEIGARAFAGYPFDSLEILEIEDAPLLALRRASFLGAKFYTFSLTYSEDHTLSIEERALDGVNNTLQTLNLKRCIKNAEAVANLTGALGTYFPNLVQIDLSYNYLSSLANASFLNAPRLVQVFLHGNKINHIENDAFRGYAIISPIKSLYLSYNSLTVLNSHTFSYFEKDVKVDVTHNPWNCTCSLQWLKDWYQNNSTLNILDSLLCANKNNDKFVNVDFGCTENNSTTPTKTTNYPDTSPHQEPPFDCIQLDCADRGSRNYDTDYDEPWDSICIGTSMMELEIYEVDVNAATYAVRVTGNVRDFHIMWYNTKNKSDYGCVTNVGDMFFMENLERQATYTICALYDDAPTTSPYDCVGFAVPQEWSSRTWIPNKMMTPVTGGFCAIVLLEAVIVGLVVFYCIRQHPKFISGNKRVVMVSTKTTDAIVMPRSYSKNAPVKENRVAAAPSSTPGYLTPKYARMNDRRKRMLRSLSESSVLSGSYISKEEIYHRRRKETTLYEVSDEEHIYECPALPPNHPSEMRKQCYQ